MKITYRGDYAMKAVFYLAINYYEKGGVLSISQIAELGDMPEKFLEQILLGLRRGGFVDSKRGVNGGFFLAKKPNMITVGDIIRCIEGPIDPIACTESDHYKGCKDVAKCIFRDVWKEVRSAISIVVDTLTFEELVKRHKARHLSMKGIYEYSI